MVLNKSGRIYQYRPVSGYSLIAYRTPTVSKKLNHVIVVLISEKHCCIYKCCYRCRPVVLVKFYSDMQGFDAKSYEGSSTQILQWIKHLNGQKLAQIKHDLSFYKRKK